MLCNIVLFSLSRSYVETSGNQTFVMNGKIMFEKDDSFTRWEM